MCWVSHLAAFLKEVGAQLLVLFCKAPQSRAHICDCQYLPAIKATRAQHIAANRTLLQHSRMSKPEAGFWPRGWPALQLSHKHTPAYSRAVNGVHMYKTSPVLPGPEASSASHR
jgi:hypothetical protein